MSYDRYAVGRGVAMRLAESGERPGSMVAGIPRGGAMVGASAALQLGLAYECLPVCRVGVPSYPDLTLGAIAPDGVCSFDPNTQLTRYELGKMGAGLARRLRSQVEQCRGDRAPVSLAGRDIIVVDEAADSALVLVATAEYLRRLGAARLTLALPVALASVVPSLRRAYDELVIEESTLASGREARCRRDDPSDAEIGSCLARAWDYGRSSGAVA